VAVAGVASSGEVVARLHEAERQLLELGHDSSSISDDVAAPAAVSYVDTPLRQLRSARTVRVAPDGVRG
jgi:hypothetical protein